jgi:nucleoside-diphosphate-sugar epimerase
MKVMLTGGTGFLGKHVLARLLANPEVTDVVIPARRKTTHPDPRVHVLACDLSQPAAVSDMRAEVDAVIHLAGHYNFGGAPTENYVNNVLTVVNLVDWVKRRSGTPDMPIHVASTYAVEAGVWNPDTGEAPLDKMPPSSRVYSWSKAQAENMLRDSGIPCAIYRLGILVGERSTGRIEKEDGPYALMRLLSRLDATGLKRFLPVLPLPINPDSYLPLVPVDVAADVFVEGLFRPKDTLGKIFGLYRTDTIKAGDLVDAILEDFGIRARPLYLKSVPERAIEAQGLVSGIPPETLRFALETPVRKNPLFRKVFGVKRVPPFSDYRQAFFAGARAWREGKAFEEAGEVSK